MSTASPPGPGMSVPASTLADVFDIPYDRQMGALAARLEAFAAAVRERCRHLGTAAATCPWDGDAARSFRRSTHETLAGLRVAASQLDDAAAAVRRHGLTVARAVDERAHDYARMLHRLGVDS